MERVSYCYGTDIGVAESPDGVNWHYRPRSTIQMAELKVIDGVLTCDRNAEVDCDWRTDS